MSLFLNEFEITQAINQFLIGLRYEFSHKT